MSTLENLKELANLAQKLGNIDLYRKIVELEGEVIELTRTKRVLEDENADLKSKVKRAATMRFKEPFWYADGDNVPYCANCWESSERGFHLTYAGPHGRRTQIRLSALQSSLLLRMYASALMRGAGSLDSE